VPPGLHITVVSDSMVVSAGRVGEGLGAIGARIGLLAGAVVLLSVNRSPDNNKTDVLDVLVCFKVELGRKALSAVRADNGSGE